MQMYRGCLVTFVQVKMKLSDILVNSNKWAAPWENQQLGFRPGPEVIKLFSCSAQLRLKFILLINVKMPTIVGILTFMSKINYLFLSFESEFSTNFYYFNIHKQLKVHAQLSWARKKVFYNLGARSDTNQAVQSQKNARCLKFWI